MEPGGPQAIIIALFSLVVVGVGVRFRSLWTNPALGVDNWYWLLCAEDIRKRRRLPPILPYFMLELEDQWYPPLFAGLLALIPLKRLERHGGKIAQLIDFFQGFLIFFAVLSVSGSVIIAFLSGFSYMVAFFPLTYNNQLQPRGLANFLLTLAIIGLWFYIDAASWTVWAGILVISVLLLFLHKMTAQMWVVYLLGIGIWSKDWSIPLLLPASMALALLVSKGFYFKMLKAHWDIVSFWHANMEYLGSHQYYESPRYKKKDFVSTALHSRGVGQLKAKLLNLIENNVFIILLPVLLFAAPLRQNGLESFLLCWLGLTYLWAFLTTFVPHFTALGSGVYYLYQTFLPLFLLATLRIQTMTVPQQWWLLILWSIGIFLSGALWEYHCRSTAISKGYTTQKDLWKVLDYLKVQPGDGVFCIPLVLSDITAYWTRKKVFWGGHSYGFNRLLKPYFPIMREDVVETLRKKHLNYLLYRIGYLDSLHDIGLKEGKEIHQIFNAGEFSLYRVISAEEIHAAVPQKGNAVISTLEGDSCTESLHSQ